MRHRLQLSQERTGRSGPSQFSSAVISLAIAGIGGLFALSGSHYGADEDRARESREKKAQVYADYLAAARKAREADDAARRTYESAGQAEEAASRPNATTSQKSLVN